MHKDELLKQLTILDFMTIDLGLYLDSHPHDSKGIKLYNKITEASDIVRKNYEANHGPIRQYGTPNECDTKWLWAEDPWPWEKEFNFTL